jgi:hypothetical protein
MSDTNTKVLLHFNGGNDSVNLDDFGSDKVWTAGGTAKCVTSKKKFGRSSLYLDGDTGYISTPDHADFTLGTSAFSFDFWINFPVLPGTTPQTIFCKYQDSSNRYYLEAYSNLGVQTFRFRSREGATLLNDASFALAPITENVWYHFELTQSGGTFYLFQNGVLVSSVAGALELSDLTGLFEIGRNSTSNYLNAYLDEFRYSYGVARHTSGFTPTSVAYVKPGVDDEYTAFLAHFTGINAATLDTTVDSVGSGLSGNAVLSTAQYKFSPSSAYFAGAKYLNTGTLRRANIFHRTYATIDMWIRFTEFAVNQGLYHENNGQSPMQLWYDQVGGDRNFVLSNFTVATLTEDLNANQWYHLAFVKNGVTLSVYVDGVFKGSADIAGTITPYDTQAEANNSVGIASTYSYNPTLYCDEYRISIDIQRWTSDFTPESDAYASTIKAANLDVSAKGLYGTDTLWDNSAPSADATAEFVTQYMYSRSLDPSSLASYSALANYWYERTFDSSALASATFTAGYYIAQPIDAKAIAAFETIYVKFFGITAQMPFPTLSAKTGNNAWTDPFMEIPFPTLEAVMGLSVESSMPFFYISATGSVQGTGNLRYTLKLPTLNASMSYPVTGILNYVMTLPSISATGYADNTATLSYSMKLPLLYAKGFVPRDFSTYVLRYVR